MRYERLAFSSEEYPIGFTFRTVSYMAINKTFSGTVPQWLFLQDFQPVTESKKKAR